MNSVQELKEKGNQAFKDKQYQTAIQFFTQAIDIESSDHIIFSNRSACYFNLNMYDEAVNDAEVCVILKEDWWKGYYRKGLAQLKLNLLDEATASIKEGIKYEDNITLRGVLNEISEAKLTKVNPFNIDKLYNHPKTKEYMKDPSFVMGVMSAMNDPSKLSEGFLKDPRYSEALGVLTGVDFSKIDKNGFVNNFMNQFGGKGGQGFNFDPMTLLKNNKFDDLIPKSEDKNEIGNNTKTDKVKDDNKAEEYNNKGNDYFRENKLQEALKSYNDAINSNSSNPKYYSNRAACYNKMSKFENAIDDCDKAIEIDLNFLKAYVRKGNILLSNQQYKDAKETFLEGLKVKADDNDLLSGISKCEEYLKKTKSNLYT